MTRVLPDLVVCDIVMADHDGYWFLSELQRLPCGRDVPVGALTRGRP